MNPRALSLVTAVAVTSLLAYAAGAEVRGFPGQWSLVVDPVSGTRSWVGHSSKSVDPGNFRSDVAKALSLNVDQISESYTQQGLDGKQLVFHQRYQGYEIANAGILVRLNHANGITYFRPDVAQPPAESTPPPVPENRAAFVLEAAQGGLPSGDKAVISVRSVARPALYAGSDRVARWALTARLEVTQPGDASARIVDLVVAIPDGAVLAMYNRFRGQSPPGAHVFYPTPLSKCTAAEYQVVAPNVQYREVTLLDLDANTKVANGKYAHFLNLDSTPNPTWKCDDNGTCDYHFSWLYDPQQFSEVMTYYLITTVQRHVQGLGFMNLANRPIRVDVVATLGQYRAEYSDLPIGNGDLLFGFENGHSVADDGKVVVHEYGHALQAPAVAGQLSKPGDPEALSEGFADYLALSTFAADESPDCLTCIGALMNDGVCLRDLRDNPSLTYNVIDPTQNPKDPYELGAIWTRALWTALTTLAQNPAIGWAQARDLTDRAALLGN